MVELPAGPGDPRLFGAAPQVDLVVAGSQDGRQEGVGRKGQAGDVVVQGPCSRSSNFDSFAPVGASTCGVKIRIGSCEVGQTGSRSTCASYWKKKRVTWKNTGAANVSESMRSRTPPWPGISAP